MAGIKISQLPALPSEDLTSLDLFPVARDNTTYKATIDSLPQYYTFRNKIINGDMRIDQRNAGASATVASGLSMQYTLDRWYGAAAGASVTHQRVSVSGIPLTNTALRITGATGNTTTWAAQRIESSTAISLAGSQATLSFYAASNTTRTLRVGWGCPSSATPDDWSGSPTLITQDITITPTFSRYTITLTVPAEASKGFYVSFYSNGPLIANQTISITNVQLEPGSNATTFEHRPLGTELSLCQRYYEKGYDLSSAVGINLMSNERYIPFKVQKRVIPTISAQSGQVLILTGGSSGVAEAKFIDAYVEGWRFQFRTTVNLIDCAPYSYWQASAEI
jgi:hypothetical protein